MIKPRPHETDEELLKPLWIATQISHRPCVVFWITMIAMIIMTILDGMVFEPDLDRTDRTLLVEDDDYSIWFDAWTLAEEASDQSLTDTQNQTFFPQTEEVCCVFYVSC